MVHSGMLMNLVEEIETAERQQARVRSKRSKRGRRVQLYCALILLDLACIFAGFVLLGLVTGSEMTLDDGVQLAALVTPIYIFVGTSGYAYDYTALVDHRSGARQAVFALLLATVIIMLVAFYGKFTGELSRLALGGGTAVSAVMLMIGRYGFSFVVRALLGDNPRAELVVVDRGDACAFAHVPSVNAADVGLRPDLRDPAMLDRFGKLVAGIDHVVIVCRDVDRAAWSVLLKGANVQGYISAPEFDEVGAYTIDRYRGRAVMQVSLGPLDLRSRALKRLMDLAITIPMLIALAPVFLLIAVAIKLDSPGPVFFLQTRMGRSNRLFQVIKFRSMRSELTDASGARSASRTDDRITRVGRFIRRTSLDELPQLINVFHGDMSLVGPRPHALGSLAGLERFWDVDQRYWHRHAMKPGITGLAQIRGLRGATLKRDDLVKRLQADLEYMNEWSIGLDLRILVATLRVLVHRNAF